MKKGIERMLKSILSLSKVKKLVKGKKSARIAVPASEIVIRPMIQDDIDRIIQTFSVWNKQRSQYENYLDQQQRSERVILVAFHQEKVVGYGTLMWKSPYVGFRNKDIPEIIDLNVIGEYQGSGIGSQLIAAAEQVAREQGKSCMGISVEQTPEYEKPNRLYPRLGYVPDGTGIDEENLLHLVKNL
jgi:GNAT superfamily N-acetyltransferase